MKEMNNEKIYYGREAILATKNICYKVFMIVSIYLTFYKPFQKCITDTTDMFRVKKFGLVRLKKLF